MFTFKIEPDGGEAFEVVATSRDVVRWEKTGKGRSLGRLSENPLMADLTSLAFFAARRSGQWSGTEDEFLDQVDVVVVPPDDDEDESGAGPTRTGR